MAIGLTEKDQVHGDQTEKALITSMLEESRYSPPKQI
jgi:hypothetical protein